MQIYKDNQLELHIINGGNFWLDGGAMFGVVPKVIWEKLFDVNEYNQIPMATNSLLVKYLHDNRMFLIDTGNGNKYTEKEKNIYKFDNTTIETELIKEGFDPEEITDVILTHLHFDHCGGSTKLNGRDVIPVFQNANYYIQETEWNEAVNTHERNRASYLQWDFLPLMEEGKVILTEGETELTPEIFLVPTPGHTLGHQSIKIKTKNDIFFFAGDLIPTSRHVPTPYIMAYDLYPVTTVKTKNEILNEAAKKDWTIIFEHDPDTPSGKIEKDNKNRFYLRG